jgi:hypothetical protein
MLNRHAMRKVGCMRAFCIFAFGVEKFEPQWNFSKAHCVKFEFQWVHVDEFVRFRWCRGVCTISMVSAAFAAHLRSVALHGHVTLNG